MKEFKNKAISAFLWSAAQTLTSQGLVFTISIVLARFISPSEFGLVAMLSIFVNLGDAIVNSGLSQSLIREKNVSEEEYSSVFYFNVGISLVIYVIFYNLAPFIAAFYHQDLMTSIVRMYFIIFIIKSLSLIQNTYLVKGLNFKQQFKISLPSQLISGSCGIIMAIKGFGVWSLIYSMLIQSTLECLQLWYYTKWRPLLSFSFAKLKIHFKFGYKLTISSIIDSVMGSFMNIIIGKYFSVYQVGIYSRANSLKQLPADGLISILGKVSQPLFAQIQDDTIRLKAYYKLIMQVSFLFLTPILMMAFVMADSFVMVLLTERWIEVVPYFRILCITGILFPLQVFNLHIINVKGRSDLNLKLEIVKVILNISILYIAMQSGIYALLYGNVILSILGVFINSTYSKMFIDYSIFSQIRDVAIIVMYALIASLCSYFVIKFFLSGAADIFKLLVGTFSGSIIYVSFFYFTNSELLTTFKQIRR